MNPTVVLRPGRIVPVVALVTVLVVAIGCGADPPSAPSTEPATTAFYLSNTSAEPVLAIHMRQSGASEWGKNWLRYPIEPGNWYGYVGRVPSGYWDVRMVGSTREITQDRFHITGPYLAIGFH